MLLYIYYKILQNSNLNSSHIFAYLFKLAFDIFKNRMLSAYTSDESEVLSETDSRELLPELNKQHRAK